MLIVIVFLGSKWFEVSENTYNYLLIFYININVLYCIFYINILLFNTILKIIYEDTYIYYKIESRCIQFYFLCLISGLTHIQVKLLTFLFYFLSILMLILICRTDGQESV